MIYAHFCHVCATYWKYFGIGLGSGLAPNWRKAIPKINDNLTSLIQICQQA